ncbi:MAG: M20/M25/M40 family metallo-hydrolase [Anaerolineales bacterium]|nr:M20/M25/M40 family metallo-hydrolase [Anaerolineales bacterium]
MELKRLLHHTCSIQAIPAPTFHEAARAAYLRGEFEHAGLLDVRIDPVGNLYGRVPGGEKAPLIISAHLDTVFPAETPLEVLRTGERIIGPGVGDNALSLAMLIELALDLMPKQLPGDVWLVANIGEEGLGNLRGMREVVKRFGDRVSGYLVLEGMALGHIYNCGLPVRRYRLTMQTQGGHSWIHAGRPSAIHTLLEFGAELVNLDLPETPRTTLNIGRMEGGISINAIASEAFLEIDLRSEDEQEITKLEKEIYTRVDHFAQDTMEIRIDHIGERPGGMLASDHPLILAASHALETIAEEEIQLKCGSTDANIPLSLGLPAICIGLTHGGGAHSMDEYIEIEPILRGYQALLQLIQTALEQA